MSSPDFSAIFGDLFRTRIPFVPQHVAKRIQDGDDFGAPSRRRRNVDFIETDLRYYLADQPDLRRSLKIEDERIDYYCISLDGQRMSARCEMKGPARQNLLTGHDGKWFRYIKADVEKQYSRSKAEPNIAHFVAVMVYGSSGEVAPGFETYSLKPLQERFASARIGSTLAQTVVNNRALTVFLLNVEATSVPDTGRRNYSRLAPIRSTPPCVPSSKVRLFGKQRRKLLPNLIKLSVGAASFDNGLKTV